MKRYLCFAAITILLTGCFGPAEPTAKEISAALKAAYLKHGTQWVELISAEKIGCVAAKDKPGFSCDVKLTELKADIRSFNPVKTIQPPRTVNIRFVKSENGWEAIPE